MIKELERLNDESYLQYAKRITFSKADKTLDIDYVEWGKLLIDKEYSSENLRKMFYFVKELLINIEDEQVSNFTEDDLLKEIESKRIGLKKDQQKFYDQRTAFNKIVRERARQEEVNDIIIHTVQNSTLPKLEYIPKNIQPSNNDLLISLNDIHYGMQVDNAWNKYNSDICKQMFNKYLDEIIAIQQLHNSENCYVCMNGDAISGNIHKSIALENKENVIQQVIGVSELISDFVAELSKHFKNVVVSMVSGNHSRLGESKDVVKDERLDDLCEWYAKARLQNFKNVIFNDNKLDNTMYILDIRGKKYVGVHGDYDNSNYKIQSLVQMSGEKIYAVLLGHLHHNKTDWIQGIKTLMSGSFVGMDSYCVEKRIIGHPQQLVCVCTDKGVLCHYDINF